MWIIMLKLTKQNKDETAKQYVTRTLLSNILNFNLKPGEKIIESELCEQYGISRTPIREAILELNQKKMIDIYPKQGTYVSYIDLDIIMDFIGLRRVLESELAKISSTRLVSSDLDHLRENIAVWQYYMTTGNVPKMYAQDKLFHKYIYEICGKHFWHDIIDMTSLHFDRAIILLSTSLNTDFLLNDHNEIVKAFEQHDPDRAAAVSHRHLNRYLENKDMLQRLYPDYFKSGVSKKV